MTEHVLDKSIAIATNAPS